ncbi:DUF4366 domain-containing protein [Oscillibacter sp. CU971]|uniref:DUF4366 domain-containing protein n=1 Tax=Oscillibacter sp. CU971 TaxID=2780102 RepID=UPI00195AE8E8|nr:DUF4366 domain-containing protein [Oscillibacter sp. CU971]
MTKGKPLQRIAALLLCVFLCLGAVFSMMGAAHAAEVEPSGIAIEIMLPPDWASASAAAKVCVTDETGGGFASVEVRIDRGSSWRDITASMERRDSRYYGTIMITSNCTIYVRVTGHDGEVYENSRYMECFDATAPTLRGSVSGNVLKVEAADDFSGVAQITVNGKCYTSLTNGAVEIPLKDLGTGQQITVQAADHAGNYSQTYQVKNPNYKAPAASQSTQGQKPTTTTPVKPPATSATNPPSGSASVTPDPEGQLSAKPLTPDGQGTVVDNVTDQDSKEFFTFTTPSENTFYLVIDKQRESENVYFLNAVTESDLFALAEKDKEPEDNNVSAIPDPEPVCNCEDKCAPGEVDTDCPVCPLTMKDCTGKVPAADPEGDKDPEPEKPEKGSSSTMILVVIAALAVGGAGYYLKIYKPKHDLDDAEDFDELTGEDEETVNEDDLEPAPRRGPCEEPEEPDYQEYYGYEEPEDEE